MSIENWAVLSRYDAAHLREIAKPIGGIGSGFFRVGHRGQLTDWQFMAPELGCEPRRGCYCVASDNARNSVPYLTTLSRVGAQRSVSDPR